MTAWITVWRVAAETAEISATDLSGAGAKISGGRWNSPGVPMLYCSEGPALAHLETLVVMRTFGLPLDRYLVGISIPASVYRKREHAGTGKGSLRRDPSMTDVEVGDQWLMSMSSALLTVPSIIIPEQDNLLINPKHPDAASIVVTTSRRLERLGERWRSAAASQI